MNVHVDVVVELHPSASRNSWSGIESVNVQPGWRTTICRCLQSKTGFRFATGEAPVRQVDLSGSSSYATSGVDAPVQTQKGLP